MNLLKLTVITIAAMISISNADAAALHDIPLKDINGKSTSLKDFKGKVLLVVNVASKCGFTRQYKPLEAVHRKYRDQGFSVLGFPSNDFGGQEPGTLTEIQQFCETKFNVTFPLFDKVKVKSGPEQHPLYTALTGKESPFPGNVKWNFGKFLISRDGKILARFDPGDEPDSEKVLKAIESALAAK